MRAIMKNNRKGPGAIRSCRIGPACLLLYLAAALSGPPDAGATLLGVEPVRDILPWHHETYVTNAVERPLTRPVELLLSKHRYPAEDGHLDVVLWLDAGPAAEGELEILLHGPDGETLSADRIDPIPHPRLFFSVALPDSLHGRAGRLEVRWHRTGKPMAHAAAPFEVAAPVPVERAGRIALTIPNRSGARAHAVPMTVGIPFPRGALTDDRHVRLVDEDGREHPLQTAVTGRWSRFGPIRWLLCDFTAEVSGEPVRLYLEYGPDVQRGETGDGIAVEIPGDGGFPGIETGRLSVRRSGVYFDAEGDGNFRRVLGPGALHGGFVEHEDGRTYRMAAGAGIEVEEDGPEKVAILSSGYYRAEDDAEFCRYHTRAVFHRNSPLIRLVHTWIFTGDGNADRIRTMGWRFDLDDALAPDGFLDAFGPDGSWREGNYLLQHDYPLYDLVGGSDDRRDADGRLPGVMAASGAGMRALLGVQEFWQNFPSELAFTDGAMVFHNWPRHGRSPRHSPATLDDAIRLWFVHEGEMLDFRLPDEFVEEPFYSAFTAGGTRSFHYEKGRPETANAQGIARTEEMWIYITADEHPKSEAATVLEGLNDLTLRAVVDPAWMAASGAFYEIHPRDIEHYPAHERIYEEHALAPLRWNERVGLYGMWVYGDTLHSPNLRDGSARIYRGLRKSHHGWPYSWVPFVRSGDPRFLRPAHAGTRQMVDANHCHYATEAVDFSTGTQHPRRRGIWFRSHIPWAGRRFGPSTRSYQNENNYLWHAWYVTGDRRARDILDLWGEEVKVEESITHRGPITVSWRTGITMLKAFVEAYEGTWDPWFLAAAHALADLDRAENERTGWLGHTWQPGPREFLRFSGCPDYREYYLAYARDKGGESNPGWAATQPQIETNAYAWWLTGEPHFLRRLAGELDWARQSTYEGDVEWYRGMHIRRAIGSGPLFTSWYLYQMPLALAAFEAAGGEPGVPVPNRFPEAGDAVVEPAAQGHRQALPRIAFEKRDADAVPVELTLQAPRESRARYRLHGPTGWEPAEGEWDARETRRLEVPASAPEGVYWLAIELEMSGRRPGRILMPVTPPDVPEVFLKRDAVFRHVGADWSQYYFRMPDDAESFAITFLLQGGREYYRRPVRRVSVWNSAGARAWDRNVVIDHIETYDESVEVEAQVDVPPEERGRVWRITLPGDGIQFEILTPGVQPVFAAAPGRWFDPGPPPEAP